MSDERGTVSLTPEQEAAALELARDIVSESGMGSPELFYERIARAVLHFAEERDAEVAGLAAVLEIRTETMAEREALLSDLSKACAWFAAISGALLDAGMAVSDETSYADAVRKLAAERDAAIKEARLTSLKFTPEWSDHRTPSELAEIFKHMGYADGDAGYICRYFSYGEATLIQSILLERDALKADVARLRERLEPSAAVEPIPIVHRDIHYVDFEVPLAATAPPEITGESIRETWFKLKAAPPEVPKNCQHNNTEVRCRECGIVLMEQYDEPVRTDWNALRSRKPAPPEGAEGYPRCWDTLHTQMFDDHGRWLRCLNCTPRATAPPETP